MATIAKTAGVSLISLQELSVAPRVVMGTPVDVSAKMAATIFIHFGRGATTALTAPVRFRIEASSKDSGDGHWYPLAVLDTDTTACESEALNATEPAGETVLAVASTTNLSPTDQIFIRNSTPANSEWARIINTNTNTSVTIEDGLLNEQSNANSIIYDRAEMYAVQLDLAAVTRLRVVVDGSLAAQTFSVEAHAIWANSIG